MMSVVLSNAEGKVLDYRTFFPDAGYPRKSPLQATRHPLCENSDAQRRPKASASRVAQPRLELSGRSRAHPACEPTLVVVALRIIRLGCAHADPYRARRRRDLREGAWQPLAVEGARAVRRGGSE
jgi:hypothetical protein